MSTSTMTLANMIGHNLRPSIKISVKNTCTTFHGGLRGATQVFDTHAWVTHSLQMCTGQIVKGHIAMDSAAMAPFLCSKATYIAQRSGCSTSRWSIRNKLTRAICSRTYVGRRIRGPTPQSSCSSTCVPPGSPRHATSRGGCRIPPSSSTSTLRTQSSRRTARLGRPGTNRSLLLRKLHRYSCASSGRCCITSPRRGMRRSWRRGSAPS
mmetsp:Transcript_12397/g.30944  ORF Transcript_12397/g.30944 Transcript_12397/m.30944 type:complete len:209 (+) Transcript_12397:3-629(+)